MLDGELASHQKRVQHQLYESSKPRYIVIDARCGDTDKKIHSTTRTTIRRINESQTNKLRTSLRVGSDLLLKYLADKVNGPIVIIVVDEHGTSSAPCVAESIHASLKANQQTSRRISLKHLNEESLPKRCSVKHPCRVCVVGEDGPASDKSTRIYQKMKEAADDFVYHNFMLAFLIEKVTHRGNTAVESLRDDRDDRRKREDRKKDEGPSQGKFIEEGQILRKKPRSEAKVAHTRKRHRAP